VFADWEPYAALRYLKKPVDLIMVQAGTHVMTNPMQRLTAETIKCGLVPFLAKGRRRFRPFQNETVQALARAEEDAEREPIKRKLHSPIEKALEPAEVIALVKNTSRKTTQKQTVPPQVTIDFGAHCLARECHASRKC
jgi:hypothetical protein